MNKSKIILIMLLTLMLPIMVTAIQPTQQYNKLYLNPYYQPSMALNTNYTFTVHVAPPDGVSTVSSAIISFNGQINGQTQSFQIWVNGVACTTSNYSVATAFSTTGNVQFSFDCTNRINQSGNYNITLRSSVNTGAMSGALELTYMNNPLGSILLHGTEYVPGDSGKMFLQFLDSYQQAINNSACLISIWYPNTTYFVNNSAMTYLNEGIYYYNFVVPSIAGVYPAAARCYVPYQFPGQTIQNKVTEGFESNSWIGGTGWATPMGTWDYYNAFLYTNVSAGTGGCAVGSYCAGVTGTAGSTEYLERGFVTEQNVNQISICYSIKQSGFGNGDQVDIDIFDGTWHVLDSYTNALTPNVWTYHCHNASTSAGYNLDANSILFGIYPYNLVSGSKGFFIDNISIAFSYVNTTLSNTTAYQVLLGSGEVHVSNLYSSINASISPAAIWNYSTRTLTATAVNVTDISNAVWNATNRNLTYYPTATVNTTDIANSVWNATNRNLTYYNMTDTTNYALIQTYVWNATTRTLTATAVNVTDIANAVWNYTSRNLTYFPSQLDLTNYSLIQTYVWNATTRNLTYFPTQTDMTNYSLIASTVWGYSTRNLTYFPTQLDLTNYTLINSGVWSYATRNLTYYPAQTDLTNYGLIQTYVWNATDRNLTYYPAVSVDNNAVAVAVWNYTTRNLTYYPAQVDLTNYSLINSGVWSYTNRNLTYYPAQVDLTNYSAIESGVWSYTNRNLTFYPTQSDLTNYTLINDGVWSYANRTLTYYPIQTDMTNYSAISQGVWNYTVRDLTYYQVNNLSAADVWTYINRTLSYYEVNNISATDVWAYNNRTLTYYPSQSDLTNYTAIWTYPDRNLTYYPTMQVNASDIAENVWNASARYTHGVILN